VDEDGNLRNNRVFCKVDAGVPDGLCVDIHGNIWTSCENGVVCFDAGGTQLGRIKIPQTVANLTFGGAKRDRLFITATKSLYAVYVASSGIQRP
jgi:gluconolactonase